MASSPISAASAISPRNTARWSWSMTAMRSASSASMAAGRPSIAASKAGSTSSPARSARRSAALRAVIRRPRREVVDWLRQRSRPYLFSNTLAPVIAAASLKVFDLIEHGDALRERLYDNAALFRTRNDQARLHAGRRGPSDHSRHAGRCVARAGDGSADAGEAGSMSSAFPSPSCRRARRASARRCRRRIRGPMSRR